MKPNLIEFYKDLLIKLVNHDYPESKNPRNIVVFNSIQGRKYEPNRELMIIGRATNGWDTYYKPDSQNAQIEIAKTIEKIKNRKYNFDLTAEVTSWENNDIPYYISKSRFWNTGLRVATTVLGHDNSRTDHIVYSNLFKVSSDGNNPSPELKELTLASNIKILNAELEFFKPKKILFLTGYNGWAKPFIKELNATPIELAQSKYIHFSGKIGETSVVVADHPQGKGKTITDEIRMAFKTLN